MSPHVYLVECERQHVSISIRGGLTSATGVVSLMCLYTFSLCTHMHKHARRCAHMRTGAADSLDLVLPLSCSRWGLLWSLPLHEFPLCLRSRGGGLNACGSVRCSLADESVAGTAKRKALQCPIASGGDVQRLAHRLEERLQRCCDDLRRSAMRQARADTRPRLGGALWVTLLSVLAFPRLAAFGERWIERRVLASMRSRSEPRSVADDLIVRCGVGDARYVGDIKATSSLRLTDALLSSRDRGSSVVASKALVFQWLLVVAAWQGNRDAAHHRCRCRVLHALSCSGKAFPRTAARNSTSVGSEHLEMICVGGAEPSLQGFESRCHRLFVFDANPPATSHCGRLGGEQLEVDRHVDLSCGCRWCRTRTWSPWEGLASQ